MLDRVRIGAASDRARNRPFKASSDVSVICCVVGDPIGFRHKIRTWRDHEGRSRVEILRFSKEVRVKRYLQDRVALRFPGKLGVNNFVGPSTEPAGRIHATEDIGPTIPPAGLKRSLNDDGIAAAHGFDGRRDRLGVNAYPFDDCNGRASRFKVFDEGLLMQFASFKDAGVTVAAARYNGTIHDFVLLNAIRKVPSTEAAIDQINDGLRQHIGPATH